MEEIKIDRRNYRKHSDRNKSLINKSLSECGAGRSILIDNENSIVAGNGIYEQSQKLGIPIRVIETDGTELIAVKRTDLATDDDKRKQLAIMDNSTSDSSEFDMELLAEDFDVDTLSEFGVDAADFRLSDEADEDNFNESDIPDDEKPLTKRGDVWILGNHRLLCGDATKVEDVEKLMNGEKADCVFTDPPYNVASHSRNYAANGKTTQKTYKTLANQNWDKNFDITPALENINLFSKKDCVFYVCTSQFLIQKIWDWADKFCDFNNYVVWCKPNPTPSLSKRHWTFATELIVYATRGRHVCNFPTGENFLSFFGNEGSALQLHKFDFLPEMNYWTLNKEAHTENHPTQKPISVPFKALGFSSLTNSIVLDLFGGSGTTLMACEQLGRKCRMMELDEHYCDVIIRRWQKFTGADAVLESTSETFNDLEKRANDTADA